MSNVNRTEYTQAYGQSIEVYFSRPTSYDDQSDATWIPLNPGAGYTDTAPTRSCAMGTQALDGNVWNIQFDTNPRFYAVRIKMKGSFTSGNRVLTGLSLTKGHSQEP